MAWSPGRAATWSDGLGQPAEPSGPGLLDTSEVNSTPETRQLERFLAWNFWGNCAAALFVFGVWLVFRLAVALWMACLVAIAAAIVGTALRLAQTGAPEAATRRFALAAWLVALMVGLVVPVVFPVIALVAFLPLAIVIPYGSQRFQVVSFAVGGGIAGLLAVATFFESPFSLDAVPAPVLHAVNVIFIPVLAALFCLSVWSGYLRLRAANVALQQSESSLEGKVEERTRELLLSRGQLAAARDQAVAANSAKSRFLAAASHDLRQPIHALRLFAEALGSGTDPERMRELAGRIQASADSLTAMFDELLDLSRLESGAVEAHPTEFPLGPLLEQLASELAPDAAARGIELRVVPTSALVRSDPLLLRRILQNLLVNALRYTERGRVLSGCRRRGDMLRIEVWDTGPGIPEAKLDEIFREFTQLDQARRSEGLGLGLAIVDKLARLLDCRVEVNSYPGRGSVFRVTVPLCRRSSALLSAAGSPSATLGLAGRLVVVIDDDLNILEAMQVLLKGWGCEVLVARSLEDALDGLERLARDPDLILADYSLESARTGVDAIEAIRAARATQTPALIITGETDPQVLERVRASGFPHLIKPIPPARLRAALGSALRGSREPERAEPGPYSS
jgi:signal transduction histidine kinase/CheY-like chemotaxis protein